MARLPEVSTSFTIPEGVSASIDAKTVTINGPRGSITKDLSKSPVELVLNGQTFTLTVRNARRKEIATLKTIQSIITSMATGVTKGFRYSLKIVYAHFPIQIEITQSKVLVKNFGGEKAPRVALTHGKVNIKVAGDDILVEGNDLQDVSQTAINIQRSCKIKGFDPRVFQDGVYVYKKEVIQSA